MDADSSSIGFTVSLCGVIMKLGGFNLCLDYVAPDGAEGSMVDIQTGKEWLILCEDYDLYIWGKDALDYDDDPLMSIPDSISLYIFERMFNEKKKIELLDAHEFRFN